MHIHEPNIQACTTAEKGRYICITFIIKLSKRQLTNCGKNDFRVRTHADSSSTFEAENERRVSCCQQFISFSGGALLVWSGNPSTIMR